MLIFAKSLAGMPRGCLFLHSCGRGESRAGRAEVHLRSASLMCQAHPTLPGKLRGTRKNVVRCLQSGCCCQNWRCSRSLFRRRQAGHLPVVEHARPDAILSSECPTARVIFTPFCPDAKAQEPTSMATGRNSLQQASLANTVYVRYKSSAVCSHDATRPALPDSCPVRAGAP